MEGEKGGTGSAALTGGLILGLAPGAPETNY
jgi:hypothetical protein